jgi:hypothetical protein
MGSLAAFFLAGLYPIPATRQFLLSSPHFAQISFSNPAFNTTTTVRSKNFSGNPADGNGGKVFIQVSHTRHQPMAANHKFGQSVTVNGQPYKSNCYLDWDVFTGGATVELMLTEDINVSCGSGVNALPPSLSTGGFDYL